jgi:beta-lactamase class A
VDNERRWDAVARVVAEAPEGTTVGVAVRVLGTGEKWESGGETVLPAASTIKLAILVALYREVDAGRIDLATEVAVEPGVKVQGSGVLTWMRDGLRISVGDVAYLMISISDNTASNMLIDLVGLGTIAATVADLGLPNMALNRRFLGRMPGPDMPENVTSAADLADLLVAVWEDRAASPASCAAMRETLKLQQHRDRIPRLLPDTYVFGGKTGTVGDVVHDAGVVETPNGLVAIGLMTQGFTSKYDADILMGRIAAAAVGVVEGEG